MDTIKINEVELVIGAYNIVGTYRPIPVKITRMENLDGTPQWAILQGSHCMNRKGLWEYNSDPSSRTEAFFKRCRFDTVEKAVDAWLKSGEEEWVKPNG